MAKLSFKAKPTFVAKVEIPRAGDDALVGMFTFKHRMKSDFDEWVKTKIMDDVAGILDMVEGWDFEEPFNPESVKALIEHHMSAAYVITETYIKELTQARLGN
jgi:hypothetical protein